MARKVKAHKGHKKKGAHKGHASKPKKTKRRKRGLFSRLFGKR